MAALAKSRTALENAWVIEAGQRRAEAASQARNVAGGPTGGPSAANFVATVKLDPSQITDLRPTTFVQAAQGIGLTMGLLQRTLAPKMSDAAAASRATTTAIQGKNFSANVNVSTTVNFNGRTMSANLERYTTTVGGGTRILNSGAAGGGA